MELIFEEVKVIGKGRTPDFVEFPETEGELFYLYEEGLKGESSLTIDGDYSDVNFGDAKDITPSNMLDINGVELKTLSGFGVIGAVHNTTTQKLLIYEYQKDVSKYLTNGSIAHSIDAPISSFESGFKNPTDEMLEELHDVLMNEYGGMLSPGAKVTFKARFGDSDGLNMGTFYIDRGDFSLLEDNVTVDGRNLLGKALRDQTLDDTCEFTWGRLDLTLRELLKNANLTKDQYLVENTTVAKEFTFKPDDNILGAIEEILKSVIDWKIEELADGTIVIGSPGFAGFEDRNVYNFERGKEVFSRAIAKDDQNSYSKVCVHDEDFQLKTYTDVSGYEGWNLQANKTLFVPVPTGTTQEDIDMYSLELATRLQNVGKIETFAGPFRPQLVCGDEAKISDTRGNTSLGLITGVKHMFGIDGVFTEFVVDSGGRLGQGRFSDYIDMLGKKKVKGLVKNTEPAGAVDLWDGTYQNEIPYNGAFISDSLARLTNSIPVTESQKYDYEGVNRLRIVFLDDNDNFIDIVNADDDLVDRVRTPSNATKVRVYYQYDYSGTDAPSIKKVVRT
jgi:hypothetical protein